MVIWKAYRKAIQRSKQEGILEANFATARKMLEDGVEPRLIERYTGVTLEELKKLQENG